MTTPGCKVMPGSILHRATVRAMTGFVLACPLVTPAGAQRPVLVPQLGHGKLVTSVAIRHDGKVLASADADGIVNLWHVPTGLLLRSMRCPDKPMAADTLVAFDPAGRSVAAAPTG